MTNISSLISSNAVQGAYRNSKDLTSGAIAQADETKGPGFSEMLEAASKEAVVNLRETDQVLEAGLQGELDTQQIIEATMALESSITVAISVRDKFVAAYQEILRMPI